MNLSGKLRLVLKLVILYQKKGVKVLYNVIPEGRHCEEDWEKRM